MKQMTAVLLLLVLFSFQAAHAQPSNFTRFGGAIFVGASKCQPISTDSTPCRPRWGAAYRLYEPVKWINLSGFIGPENLGLAACFRLPSHKTSGGHLITFSAGPGYGIPLSGNGINSGRFGGLFVVSVESGKP